MKTCSLHFQEACSFILYGKGYIIKNEHQNNNGQRVQNLRPNLNIYVFQGRSISEFGGEQHLVEEVVLDCGMHEAQSLV